MHDPSWSRGAQPRGTRASRNLWRCQLSVSLRCRSMSVLDACEMSAFVDDGYVKVAGAFSAGVADRCVATCGTFSPRIATTVRRGFTLYRASLGLDPTPLTKRSTPNGCARRSTNSSAQVGCSLAQPATAASRSGFHPASIPEIPAGTSMAATGWATSHASTSILRLVRPPRVQSSGAGRSSCRGWTPPGAFRGGKCVDPSQRFGQLWRHVEPQVRSAIVRGLVTSP